MVALKAYGALCSWETGGGGGEKDGEGERRQELPWGA